MTATLAESEARIAARIESCGLPLPRAPVTGVQGMLVECAPLGVRIGDVVDIQTAGSSIAVSAEVVGLRNDRVLLMPHAGTEGLCLSCAVVPREGGNRIGVGEALLGRVIDAAGAPLDGLPSPVGLEMRPRAGAPVNPLRRSPIQQPLATGVRAIDLFTPLGRGQRIGIFAGSGVGKSTLLGMICRHAEADVVVVGLIGERGREVADFVAEQRRSGAIKRTVVVAASADQPAVMRRQAAWTATAIAEHFRARGRQVLLIVDSITRFAQAQREIGLASGEPMAARGYPPSALALIPPLLERAGNLRGEGSITAIHTVLVEGDDFDEPVSDTLRATLDGHIVLDRQLATRGHYPAIDALASISRLAPALLDSRRRATITVLRRHLATYRQSQDLIELGAYLRGSDAALDTAIDLKPRIDALLTQSPEETVSGGIAWQEANCLAEVGTGANDVAG